MSDRLLLSDTKAIRYRGPKAASHERRRLFKRVFTVSIYLYINSLL